MALLGPPLVNKGEEVEVEEEEDPVIFRGELFIAQLLRRTLSPTLLPILRFISNDDDVLLVTNIFLKDVFLQI